MTKSKSQPSHDAPAPDDPRWQSAASVDHVGRYWAMFQDVKEGHAPIVQCDVFLLGTELRVALDGASPSPADYADKWIGPLNAVEPVKQPVSLPAAATGVNAETDDDEKGEA